MIGVDLLREILSMNVPKSPPTSLKPDFLDLLKTVSIPKFSTSDVRMIVNRVKGGEKLGTVLDSFHYEFRFSEKVLVEILNIDAQERDILNYLSLLGIYSFLTWVKTLDTEETDVNLKCLLRALLHLRRKGEIIQNVLRTAFEIFLRRPESDFSISEEFFEYAEDTPCDDLAVLMLQRVLCDADEDTFVDFMAKLIEFVLDRNWRFTDKSMCDIIASFKPLVKILDPSVLKFFSVVELSQENLLNVCRIIPDAFFHRLDNCPSLVLPKSSLTPTQYDSVRAGKAYMDFPDVPTLPDGFDPSSSVQFPPLQDLSEFYPEDVMTDIDFLIEFLKLDESRPPTLIEAFFSKLESTENDPKYLAVFGILLLLTTQMIHTGVKLNLSFEVTRKFYSPYIFDPAVTMFSNDVEFGLVNTFRSSCVDCLLTDSGEAINYVIGAVISSLPLILTEMCYRLANMTSVFGQKIRTEQRLIKTLISVMLFYQHLEIESSYDKHDIRIARTGLLALFAHLFSETDLMELFFSDSLFSNSFFALLFEESVRPFVISTLTSYLSIIDFTQNTEFQSGLMGIINMIDFLLPEERPMKLLGDLITCLSESFAYHQSGTSQFGAICLVLCQSMAKLSTSELSRSVFEKVVSFLAVMSPYFTITPLEINALISGLMSFHDRAFVASLYNKFIALLAGQPVTSVTPNFIIRQPQVLKLFIQSLFDTPKLHDMVTFIINLCKFSPRNLGECAKSDLDLFVIRYLEKAKQEEVLSTDLMKLLLELYTLLSLGHSSVQSVLRYISLMAPLDGVHVSKYQNLFIDNINNIIISSSNQPLNCFGLNGKKLKFTPNMTEFANLTTEGIDITFWLYIEPNASDYRPQICALDLGNETEVGFFLSHTSLLIFQRERDSDATGIICETLETHVWHFVTVHLQFMEKRTLVQYVIDGSKKNIVVLQPLSQNSFTNQITFIVGGRCRITADIPSRLGAIGLFQKLTPEEVISVFELGLRNNTNLPVRSIVYVSDYSQFVQDPSCLLKSKGFVDVLISQCGVTSLLPLFCQSKCKLNAGDADYCISLESLLILLRNILAYSAEAQFSFYQNKGFAIIAYLLSEHWSGQFTMKIYAEMFHMLGGLQCEPLQQQLFDEIMTDFSFIMSLDPSLHLRILKHWAQSLFCSFSAIAQNFSSFEDLMVVLRLFYWYKPIEHDLVKYERIRPPELNVKKCREYLFMLLKDYTHDGFSETDFQCCVSHVMSCAEEEQVHELLDFLLCVFKEQSRMIMFSMENEFIGQLLCFAMKRQNESILIQVLTLLTVLHHENLISHDFAACQVNVCISLFHETNMTHSLFEWLCNNLCYEPAFLSICCSVAIYLSEFGFLSAITPSSSFLTFEFWAMWPLTLSLCAPPEARCDIMKWIIRCSTGTLCELYRQIDVFLEFYPEFYEPLESLFLDSFFETLTKELFETPDLANDVFGLCERLICFNRKSNEHQALTEIYRKTYEHTEDVTQNVLIPSELLARVVASEKSEPELEFGLSFDKEGNWVHEELAKLLLGVSHDMRDKTTVSFELLLCFFLYRNGVDVTDVVSSITIPDTPEGDLLKQAINYGYSHFAKSDVRHFREVSSVNPFHGLNKSAGILQIVKASQYIKDFPQAVANFRHYCQNVHDQVEKLNTTDVSLYTNTATKQMQQFIERQNFQNEMNMLSWKRLWSALSIERGPWHNPAKKSQKRWKRDIAACFGLAPVKMLPPKTSLDFGLDYTPITKRGLLLGADCHIVQLNTRHKAHLEIHENVLRIIVNHRIFSIWYFSITSLFRRPNNGIHLFTVLGRSFHLEFESKRVVDNVIKKIDLMTPRPQRLFPFQLHDAKTYCMVTPMLSQWKLGMLSNYEYLLCLNNAAGRSFNDISSYPVFPLLLSVSDVDVFTNVQGADDPLPSAAVITYLHSIEPFASLETLEEYPKSLEALRTYAMRLRVESVPEIYSMPEIFMQTDFVLPEWATSPIALVYNLRKILESETVSMNLHRWITTVFGNPAGKFCCFDSEHPQRDVISRSSPLSRPVDYSFHPVSGSFDAAIIHEEKSLVFHFRLYEKDGHLTEAVLNLNPSSTIATLPHVANSSALSISQIMAHTASDRMARGRSTTILFNMSSSHTNFVPNCKVRSVGSTPNATTFRACGESIIGVEQGKPLAILDTATDRVSELDIGQSLVTDIDANGIWTVCGRDNATMTVVRDYRIVSNVRLFRDAVTACAVSPVFNLVVGGTRDSALIFCSTVTYSPIKVINFKHSDTTEIVARKILITPAWGFIVVYCSAIALGVMKHLILVYTVNGEFVHQTEIPFAVDFWYCWKSSKGFDYVVYAGDSGLLYFSEVFELDKGGIALHNYRCPVVAAFASPETSTLVVVTRYGQVTALPIVMN